MQLVLCDGHEVDLTGPNCLTLLNFFYWHILRFNGKKYLIGNLKQILLFEITIVF